MIPMTLADVAAAVGGRLVGTDGSAQVTGASSDSRDVKPGSLFVAVRGERTDGHAHAADAVAAGAAAALVDHPLPDVPSLVVADPVAELGRLAGHVLAELRRRGAITVIGITGSSGKTTTKDLLATVLSAHAPTVAPRESLNTEVGLPITVLEADERTRFLVLEMSARRTGHIAYLAGIAPPDLAVVLNVGSAHVGEFGSRELVAAAKGEIVEAVLPDGTIVLNADDPYVMGMAGRRASSVTVRTFGTGAGTDATVADIEVDAHATRFTVSGVRFELPVPGRHLAVDAAAAVLAAQALGVEPRRAAEVLRGWRDRSRWRMEMRRTPAGATLINDAYNANPESVAAALQALVDVASGRPTWAVLGGMAELGDETEQAHVEVGQRLCAAGVGRVVVVGELARPITVGCPYAEWVPDAAAAIERLSDALGPDDVVLVKASRSENLQRVAMALAPLEDEGGSA